MKGEKGGLKKKVICSPNKAEIWLLEVWIRGLELYIETDIVWKMQMKKSDFLLLNSLTNQLPIQKISILSVISKFLTEIMLFYQTLPSANTSSKATYLYVILGSYTSLDENSTISLMGLLLSSG